jgi:hypothetical protein
VSYTKEQKSNSREKNAKNARGRELCKEMMKLTDWSIEKFTTQFEMLQKQNPIPPTFGIEIQNTRTLRRTVEITRQRKTSKNEIRARIFNFEFEEAEPLTLLLLFHVQSGYCFRYWIKDDDVTKKLIAEKVVHFQKHLKFKAECLVITNKVLTKVNPIWSIRLGEGRRAVHLINVTQSDEQQKSYTVKMSRDDFKNLINDFVIDYQKLNGQNLVMRRKAFKKISLERGFYIEKDWLACMTNKSYGTMFYRSIIANFLKDLPFEANSDETNWADVLEIRAMMEGKIPTPYIEFFVKMLNFSANPSIIYI